MITPITEDKETIRHLLPSLGTDLAYVQGSRLSPALEMAATLLQAEPGHNKAILVVSDGGFEDSSAITIAKKLREQGLFIYTMGVGTAEGAPLRDHEGKIIKKQGSPILSKLEKERLSEISQIGNGRYLETHHAAESESVILADLEKRAEAQVAVGKKNRFWDEHFYLFLFPVLPIFLWWFRKGAIVALFFLVFHLEASEDYFKNSEQCGKEALEAGDCEKALNTFQDPYRKGVACYKAGQFAEAEQMFRQSDRPEVACSAAYNLGNCLAQQQKLKEAITVYEDVLEKWPDHTRAKENLELVKKMLEDQKQDPSDQQDNQDKKDQKDNQDQDKQDQDKQDQDKQDQDKNEKSDQDGSPNDDPNKDPNKDQQPKEPEPKPQEADHEADHEANREEKKGKEGPSQQDRDADLWLNQMNDDPKPFLKNKFLIESKKNGTTEGVDPW